jgi:hypothetical protein
VLGLTEILVSVLGTATDVTVNVAAPLTLLNEAVTVVDPAVTPVVSPAALIVATAVFATVHVAVADTSAVVPSLYVPVALNFCVAPTAMLAVPGETDIVVSVFGVTTDVTVNALFPLIPFNTAVMVVAPAVTPVATPVALTVAIAVLELDQLAVDDTSAVEPSL